MTLEHKGVFVIVHDKDGGFFYVQQKDEFYSVPEYSLGYSFFGGAIEEGEDELTALRRELSEELEPFASLRIKEYVRFFRKFIVPDQKFKEYSYYVFVAPLPKDRLMEISKLDVYEGKRGLLVSREQLLTLPFIYSLKDVATIYLNELKNQKQKNY